ncbi:MAG: ABC transporter permease [Candidatus Helarchaeota archaeon]
MNIIYALKATMAIFERQLLILWRKKLYFILGLLLPAFFIFGIGPAVQSLTGYGVSTAFVASGIICFSVIFSSMQGPLALLYDKDLGYLNVELVSPIPRYSIILGQSLAGSFRAILQCTIMYTISVLSGINFYINPLNILGFFFVVIITSIFIEGLFSGILAIAKNAETFALITNFIGIPFIFMSNVFFPTSAYQGTIFYWIEYLGYFNPVNHALNGIRLFLLGYCPGFEKFGIWIGPISILSIFLLAIIFTITGTYLFLRSVKK